MEEDAEFVVFRKLNVALSEFHHSVGRVPSLDVFVDLVPDNSFIPRKSLKIRGNKLYAMKWDQIEACYEGLTIGRPS